MYIFAGVSRSVEASIMCPSEANESLSDEMPVARTDIDELPSDGSLERIDVGDS